MLRRHGLLVTTLLLCACAPLLAEVVDPYEDPETEAFREKVEPLIRTYIFDNYDKFRSSELTFRDLKKHVASKLKMTYEELKDDRLSLVIEDETDAITNHCESGSVPLKVCQGRLKALDAEPAYTDDLKEDL